MLTVKFVKLRNTATTPTYGSANSAGADLYAALDNSVTIAAGETKMIPTGIAIEIPCGKVGLVYARSGLSVKQGLAPANKVGVIDCDYRGEIMVALHNHGNTEKTVNCGDRIAQLLISDYYTCSFVETDALTDTQRGAGGFGSTGKQRGKNGKQRSTCW